MVKTDNVKFKTKKIKPTKTAKQKIASLSPKTVKIENSKIHLIPGNKNFKEKIFNLF